MTTEQQRIAIAEFEGYAPFREEEYPHRTLYSIGGKNEGEQTFTIYDLPDYSNDLNSMREVVFKLPHNWKCEFSVVLRIVVSRHFAGWPTFSKSEKDYYTENANALQRSEAFLRTIGKWFD